MLIAQLVLHAAITYHFSPKRLKKRRWTSLAAGAMCSLIDACCVCLLITPILAQIPILNYESQGIQRWLLVDMTVVTIGGWLIIPCLMAFHLQDHIGPVPWRLAIVNAVFACLLSTSIYVMAGNFLGVKAPTYFDFVLIKSHTIVRWMFLNVSVLGVFISAVLYGVGTVSFPMSSIVWRRKSVTDQDLKDLRGYIDATSAELEEKREQEQRRTIKGTGLSDTTHHLETVLKDLQNQYDRLADRKRLYVEPKFLPQAAAWIMGAVGVYRIVSAALNIIYWRVPDGEFIRPIVNNAFELLRLPSILPFLNVNLIANVATVTYVVALITSSIGGFTKSLNKILGRYISAEGIAITPLLFGSLCRCLYCAGSLIIFRPAFSSSTQSIVEELVGKQLDQFYIQFDSVFVVSSISTLLAFVV